MSDGVELIDENLRLRSRNELLAEQTARALELCRKLENEANLWQETSGKWQRIAEMWEFNFREMERKLQEAREFIAVVSPEVGG